MNSQSKLLQTQADEYKEMNKELGSQARESQKWFAGIRQEIRQSQEKLSLEIQGNIQTQFKELREEVCEVKEIVQNQVTEMTRISNKGQSSRVPVERELLSELTDRGKAGEKILQRNTGIHEETLERKENHTMKIDTEVTQSDSGLQPVENKVQTDAGQIIRRLWEKASPDRTQDYVFQSSQETTVQTATISAVNSSSNKAAKVNNQFSEPGAAASFKAIRSFNDECQCRTQDHRLQASNEITATKCLPQIAVGTSSQNPALLLVLKR
jgi:hypothetical protein